MKRILGLDLGTNSIGWGLVEIDHKIEKVKILGLGSRIIPMKADEIKEYKKGGKIHSTAAIRTNKRGQRRLYERFILRRDRLHLVLNLLNALPNHYKIEIDLEKEGKRCGQFKTNKEPKIAYVRMPESKKHSFIFMESYEEMLQDFKKAGAEVKNEKGYRIPRDWTLYYLRNKALKEKISLEELAWVLLSYNQKRGYEKLEIEDRSLKENEIVEALDLEVKSVEQKEDDGKKYYEIKLDGNDNFTYKEESNIQLTKKGDIKEVLIKSFLDEKNGEINEEETKFIITDLYNLEIEKVEYKYGKTKEKTPHSNTITFKNGWKEEKKTKKYTYKYEKVEGKSFDYIITSEYNKEGKLKTQKYKEPDYGDNSDDWTLLKKKTEKKALEFNHKKFNHRKKYISPQIYDTLKQDAKEQKKTKIIGGLFQVVEREFYREELNDIISTQKKYHKELEDKEIFEKCVNLLYPNNKNHENNLSKNKKALQHLLVEDILLYQRPLKSKKSEIGNCKHEIKYIEQGSSQKEGEEKEKKDESIFYHKVVSASHPLFQEFRIWDKIHNLKLIELERKDEVNVDVTKEYFKSEETYRLLFEEMNNRKSINQKQFKDWCEKNFELKTLENYVWNFPEAEELKGNETRVSFTTRFKRCGFTEYKNFLTPKKEQELWHYLYSVNYKERTNNENKSIKTFFDNYFKNFEIDDEVKKKIVSDFSGYPKFASKYCAYSEKALKKLLPFIRLSGNRFTGYFDISEFEKDLKAIDYDKNNVLDYLSLSKNKIESLTKEDRKKKDNTKRNLYEALWKHTINERIKEIIEKVSKVDFENKDYSKVIDSVAPIPFPKGLFNTFKNFQTAEHFKGLNLTQASYLVYGRHSELAGIKIWNSPKQIRKEIYTELKQHSLNNPVAEKVLREMMQVVADIWDKYANEDEENFFSKIHVEIGRDLKKNASERANEHKGQVGNRKQNERLRHILKEFLSNADPINKDHFDRLKIVENVALKKLRKKDKNSDDSTKKDKIEKILKKENFTKEDFEKYKLWVEQSYKSPYTGCPISLSDLFDGAKYNIDHIFPRSSVTNDSLSNKVVCETSVNKAKSDLTGRGFINKGSKEYKILSDEDYKNLVNEQFSGTKRFILLSKEIPSSFTNSQLNNARHISRKAMELLSHIVREKDEIEFRSKNVLPVTGAITNELKRAWRLNEVWKELVTPRFKRLNELTDSQSFGKNKTTKSGHSYFDCTLNDEIKKDHLDFDIKRIDHRNHALDALIVALCTEDHINYINNINADVTNHQQDKSLQIKEYRATLKKKIKYATPNKENPNDKDWFYMLPGEKRKKNATDSKEDSVLKMNYQYKEEESENSHKVFLTALQNTIVTFKQNLRVINKATNNTWQWDNNKKIRIPQQKGIKEDILKFKKYNWAIRRSLGKETFYGKVNLKSKEEKVASRESIDLNPETFNTKRIESITDKGIERILKAYLKKFDTVKLPFDEALNYFDSTIEKKELNAIVDDEETDFKDLDDLIKFLRNNNYKYEKTEYSELNVQIEEVKSKDFRSKKKYEITKNPEIAFSPSSLKDMNEPSTLKKLNGDKNHCPIYKVAKSIPKGEQREVSEDTLSNKNKQYIRTDSGSNLFLGVYEVKEKGQESKRKFELMKLIDLINSLKENNVNRDDPFPNKDEDGNKKLFTLSPNDLVYVPTDDEIKKSETIGIKDLKTERIYKYVDGGDGYANFIHNSIAHVIFNKKKQKQKKYIGIQNEIGVGSPQSKNQKCKDGYMIKERCWKLKIDGLGNICYILGISTPANKNPE